MNDTRKWYSKGKHIQQAHIIYKNHHQYCLPTSWGQHPYVMLKVIWFILIFFWLCNPLYTNKYTQFNKNIEKQFKSSRCMYHHQSKRIKNRSENQHHWYSIVAARNDNNSTFFTLQRLHFTIKNIWKKFCIYNPGQQEVSKE